MKPQEVISALSRKKQYKFPYIFFGLYLTFLLSTVCMANKLTLLGGFILPGGIFVFPFTFGICDVLGEVYGYAYPRLIIWIGVMAELLFSLIVITVSHTSSPDYFKAHEAYQIVFDPTIRYVLSGLAGLLVGEIINIYLLAKLKIATRGRLYIPRSLISTAIGQALLTIIVDMLNYTWKMPMSDLTDMMLSGYAWKMFFALLLAFPSWLLVKYLKKAEKIDYYDINTNFNPFILSLEESSGNKHSDNNENIDSDVKLRDTTD